MAIPSSRSLIFEVKSTGSEPAFGRLRQTSDVFGRLRTSSEIFDNDRFVFKNPSTPRIKVSRLYLRKSWQVCYYEQGLGTAASEIHFIQVPGIQVCMSVLLLCSYYGVRKNTDC